MRQARCYHPSVPDLTYLTLAPANAAAALSSPNLLAEVLGHSTGFVNLTSLVRKDSKNNRPVECVLAANKVHVLEAKNKSPVDCVLAAYEAHGIEARLANTLDADYFLDPTDDMIGSYNMEIIRAVRSRDLEKLRTLHEAGQSMQCCNRYGEGLLHLACRRGFVDVLEFLISDAKVTLNVRDDFGRTPMHDACWSAKPNFEVVERLIKEVPEHLLLRDARGHTPFDYARREHWGLWVRFIQERQEDVVEKIRLQQGKPFELKHKH